APAVRNRPPSPSPPPLLAPRRLGNRPPSTPHLADGYRQIATVPLRIIKGLVGEIDQPLSILAVIGIAGNPQRERHLQGTELGEKYFVHHGLPDALGDDLGAPAIRFGHRKG